MNNNELSLLTILITRSYTLTVHPSVSNYFTAVGLIIKINILYVYINILQYMNIFMYKLIHTYLQLYGNHVAE